MKNTILQKKFLIGIATLLGVAILASFGIFSPKVKANPSFLPQPAVSATATTTISYMTPGTGTSTLTYDSFGVSGTNQTNIGNTYIPDGAVLLVQLTASSTSSILNVNLEHSVDGIDYYSDGISQYATSTLPISLSTIQSFQWKFASSTIGGAASTTNNRDTRIIPIKTPTRFVRAVLTNAIGAANIGVWAAIIPNREVHE